MSYLFFLDESGHDHRTTPYEVRGGVAIHDTKIWAFINAIRNLEAACFGVELKNLGSEIKGHKLLDKDRFKWARQHQTLDDEARRKHARLFLLKSKQHDKPTRVEFSAYGQACLQMAGGIFEILKAYDAKLFASIIPCNVKKPETFAADEFLRKDQVFMLERFFYMLEQNNEQGLLIMDESEKSIDRRFVDAMHKYFTKTENGKFRANRVIPSPFFVSSDMAYPVQVADVCIYCINFGFRLQGVGMNAPVRPEIQNTFNSWIRTLQFCCEIGMNSEKKKVWGIVFVSNPFEGIK